jgi:hypothetical protein
MWSFFGFRPMTKNEYGILRDGKGDKIFRDDMNLGKPWEEAGKEEPYSLVEKLKIVRKKVQGTVKKD